MIDSYDVRGIDASAALVEFETATVRAESGSGEIIEGNNDSIHHRQNALGRIDITNFPMSEDNVKFICALIRKEVMDEGGGIDEALEFQIKNDAAKANRVSAELFLKELEKSGNSESSYVDKQKSIENIAKRIRSQFIAGGRLIDPVLDRRINNALVGANRKSAENKLAFFCERALITSPENLEPLARDIRRQFKAGEVALSPEGFLPKEFEDVLASGFASAKQNLQKREKQDLPEQDGKNFPLPNQDDKQAPPHRPFMQRIRDFFPMRSK